MKTSGAELFVKALKEEGVDILFGYPGGFAIDLFDALYEQEEIEVILPRHEQGLIHAADGYARATGKVGVCLVTSGPGATNLVTGIATASYDSVPLVCFTGQIPTGLIGNDAFQEVDIVGMTRSISKYGITVRKREDLGRIIKEAFYIAKSGRPGPVIIDIPKDIQLALGDDDYPESVDIRGYKPTEKAHAGQIRRAVNALKKAEKPLMLLGGGVHIAGTCQEVVELAEKLSIPVVTTLMGKGSIGTSHPLFFGNVGMHGHYEANMAISKCDVLLSIGTRFNDRATGRIGDFASTAKIIHLDIDPASISKNVKVDIPIVGDAREGILALLEKAVENKVEPWLAELAGYRNEKTELYKEKEGVTPYRIINKINEIFEDPIVVTDVGQHQMWTAQYLERKNGQAMITSGGLGGMGYGFPAAIGAGFGNPDRQIVCVSGDGGIQMNIQELATAVINEIPVVVCIFNNGYLGMVRQMQDLFYKKKYIATCTRKRRSCINNCKGPGKDCPEYAPDFVKLAESYGANGIRVTKESQIEEALKMASKEKKKPTIIEFIIDWEELVYPMVPGGNALTEMLLEDGGE